MSYRRQSGTEQRAEARARQKVIWPSWARGTYVRKKHGAIGAQR